MKKAAIALFLVVALLGFTGCDIIMGVLGISIGGSVDLTVSVSIVNNDRVSIVISNTGTESAVNVPYTVVLSVDTNINLQDPKVYEGYSDVGAGLSDTITVYFSDFNIGQITSGNYFVGVLVNPNNTIEEDSVVNNKAFSNNSLFFGEGGGGGTVPQDAVSITVNYDGPDYVGPNSPIIAVLVNMDSTSPDDYAFRLVTQDPQTVSVPFGEVPSGPGDDFAVVIVHDIDNTFGTTGDSFGPIAWYVYGAAGNLVFGAEPPSGITHVEPGDQLNVTFNPPVMTGDMFEPDDSSGDAYYISIGTSENHNLTAGDQDWHVFNVLAGIEYRVETFASSSDTTDTYLEVYESDGTTLIDSNDDSGNSVFSTVTFTATADGSAYLKVRGFDNYSVGDYGVGVYLEWIPAQELDPETAFEDSIDATGDYDWFSFVSGEGVLHTVEISTTTTGYDFDTYIDLYDSSLTLVESDDDDGEGTFSLIDFTPTSSEMYYVRVRGYGWSSVGDYLIEWWAPTYLDVTIE